MAPYEDLDLESEPTPPSAYDPSPDSSRMYWIAGAIVVLILIVGGVLWFRKPAEPPKQAVADTPKAIEAPPPRTGLGPAVPPIDLPPLVLTDPLVRDLVGKLSSRPELAAWLATDGLIRNLVVCIDNVSIGESPSKHLRVLAPRTPFKAEMRGKVLVADPRSFARYDGIAQTAASLDAAGVARTYSLLKPRLIDAYKELGHPEGDIDGAVEKALVVLLQTPVPEGTEPLTEKVLSYKYQSEDLEALMPAQRHLLRMGPRNVRLVQDALRAIARELGLAASRLPAAPPPR